LQSRQFQTAKQTLCGLLTFRVTRKAIEKQIPVATHTSARVHLFAVSGRLIARNGQFVGLASFAAGAGRCDIVEGKAAANGCTCDQEVVA
jgi:hypothetical protein